MRGDGQCSHEILARYIQNLARLVRDAAGRYRICPSSALTRMLSIKVPPLGESIVEATVSRWLKKEGDAVAGGDTLVELETDKITVEVPAPRAGRADQAAAREGDVVKVDDVLGEIDETPRLVLGAKSEHSRLRRLRCRTVLRSGGRWSRSPASERRANTASAAPATPAPAAAAPAVTLRMLTMPSPRAVTVR